MYDLSTHFTSMHVQTRPNKQFSRELGLVSGQLMALTEITEGIFERNTHANASRAVENLLGK